MTITLNIFWIVVILFLCIVAFLVHSGINIHLFVKKDIHAKDCDTDVMQDLIQTMQAKYPDVKKEFIILPEKEQNIENNQEIHEINKKIDILQKDMDEVRRIQRGGL